MEKKIFSKDCEGVSELLSNFQFLSIFAVYKATSLAKPVSRFGAVSSRLDGDERALKNAQKRAEKNERIARLINETVGELNICQGEVLGN